MSAFAAAHDFDTSPYFETVARDLYRQFGEDALDVVERAIDAMQAPGSAGDGETLEIWRELRLTLLRKAPHFATVTIQ